MRLISGDCIEAMRELPDESVDAIVTDPPYGLGFMGKAWDDLPPGEEWGRECLRVLKPGGHLLAFGGSRTFHRLACAVEDAGFEVRDQMMWLYGSGFPKSLDVSKAIDKAAGAEREVIGKSLRHGGGTMTGASFQVPAKVPDLTAPATPEAEAWNGWGTALKPAHEPIVVARKPLAGTVAENVLAHGTGALNIDGCRIGFASEADERESKEKNQHADFGTEPGGNEVYGDYSMVPRENYDPPGRWPANVVLDEEAGRLLDEQSGESTSQGGRVGKKQQASVSNVPAGKYHAGDPGFGDTGGASRFFYCAKASRGERNAGLDALPDKVRRRVNSGGLENDPRWAPVIAKNNHPTVKPISLMRYLVRLVTPPEGTVLDPFLGSGTTGCAAVLEGFNFIGIEREAEYLAIAQARIEWWEKHRGDGATEEILKAAGVRDEIEAGGQLGLLEDAA